MENPVKESRLSRYVIIAVTVIIVGFLLWFFRDIVSYICLALVVSLLGMPLVRLFNRVHVGRHHCPRWLSAALALLIVGGVLLGIILGAVPLVVSQLNALNSLNFSHLTHTLSGSLDALTVWLARYIPAEMMPHDIKGEIVAYGERFLNAAFLTRVFSATVNGVVYWGILLFSVFFIAFFFLKDETLFSRALLSFFPERYAAGITDAMERVNRLLLRYFVGVALQSLAVTLLTLIGLLCLGIPFITSMVIGLFAGLFNVIPYVGGFIALGISLLLPWVMFAGGGAPMPLDQLLFLIVLEYMVIRLIDNFFLQPLIYSSSAYAHPLEIFIVLLMAAKLGGMVGMLIGVPVYTVFRVFAKEFLGNWHLVKQITKNL